MGGLGGLADRSEQVPLQRLRSIVSHPRLSPRVLDLFTLAIALALLIGSYTLRRNVSNTVDADELLPVALLALRFGRRGGMIGAALAFIVTGLWELGHADTLVTLTGYLGRAVAFVLLGLLLGSFVDKRRRLEDQLIRYFDTSLDLLATADDTGHFTRLNPAWEELLGYSSETLRSMPYIEFVHPEDRDRTLAEAAAITDSHNTVRFRNRYRRADGGYCWLEWSAARSRSGLVHAVARDITAQVHAETLLESNARMLNEQVSERTRELEEARTETLQRLARAGEYRDDATFRHTERVGKCAVDIAFGLELDHKRIIVLGEAAPLHDIGKIAIPDGILLKPGPLNDDERAIMQSHTRAGERLLGGSSSPVLQMAAVIAASHHERWDGGGYPAGLAGQSIPLVGRIVAVADVFDALTHERPYKDAWTVEEAIAEICRVSGSQFDPRVVAAFLARQAPMSSSPAWCQQDDESQASAAGAPASASSASRAPLSSIA